MFKRILLVIVLLLTTNCKSFNREEFASTESKIALPISVAAAWFGSIGSHELGHYLASKSLGGYDIEIEVLPVKKEGVWHTGYCTSWFKRDLTNLETSFLNISGPLAQFATHIALREWLQTGYVPYEAQSTVQWVSLFCMGGVYGELLLGFARYHHADFGKEPVWISGICLAGALAYDIIDFGLLDDPRRYFRVLIGEEFYKPGDRRGLLFVMEPLPGGGFLGIQGRF